MPVSHDDLMKLTFAYDPMYKQTIVLKLGPDGLPIGNHYDLVFMDDGVNPAFRNLVGASLYMYKILAKVDDVIEELIHWFESNDLDLPGGTLTEVSASIKLARRFATEGSQGLEACRPRK